MQLMNVLFYFLFIFLQTLWIMQIKSRQNHKALQLFRNIKSRDD